MNNTPPPPQKKALLLLPSQVVSIYLNVHPVSTFFLTLFTIRYLCEVKLCDLSAIMGDMHYKVQMYDAVIMFSVVV